MDALAKPEWLKKRIPLGSPMLEVQGLVEGLKLHTVCEEAHCPNLGECWAHRTATFMILGKKCTRSCGFCAVEPARAMSVDPLEPRRVAEAVQHLGLRHAVITSVTRDDLPDGGAAHFAETIAETRRLSPEIRIEVLIPDFKGSPESIATVVAARPDVINHNVETVARLQRTVRPQARYERSLDVLRQVKGLAPQILTKSGLMVGLGETDEEVVETMRDVRAIACDILTIGQYLRPSPAHLPVVEYVHPDRFARYRQVGRSLGFRHVFSSPFVRSSYHAGEVWGQVEE